MEFELFKPLVIEWANEKGLIKPENQLAQFAKVVEEVGEIGRALLKKDRLGQIDGIGDVFVTLVILSEQLELDPIECMAEAWNEIKDRKGETVNGTFIKESDVKEVDPNELKTIKEWFNLLLPTDIKELAIANVKKQNKDTLEITTQKSLALKGAFNWYNSHEDFGFWMKINAKYFNN